ncbi:C40 family peptidase [Kocuria rosea]|uniref:C40 family peptidase n=1 Tax=Kocuria rosea TaxID=1275 RepID=UPI000DFEC14C|nr:C40 family peptidase [Kocuria rosea]STX33327.1 Probable endopeptidase cgR_2070 precursor [Kocuria rosea]
MSLFTQNTARHRAETSSRAVRTTTVVAAAGAALVGSIAPAQAYAEIPAASGSSYAAPASAMADLASYTYQAPVAAQPAAPADQAPAPQQSAATSSVSPQSTATTELAPAAGGIVGTAMQGVGTGYVWGGTSFGAWDCSGFTGWVYAQNGIDIPRTSFQQIAAATPTSTPQPGDLVSQNGGNHIGIYIGGGKMVSALNPTQGTFVHSVNAMPVDGYYTYR